MGWVAEPKAGHQRVVAAWGCSPQHACAGAAWQLGGFRSSQACTCTCACACAHACARWQRAGRRTRLPAAVPPAAREGQAPLAVQCSGACPLADSRLHTGAHCEARRQPGWEGRGGGRPTALTGPSMRARRTCPCRCVMVGSAAASCPEASGGEVGWSWSLPLDDTVCCVAQAGGQEWRHMAGGSGKCIVCATVAAWCATVAAWREGGWEDGGGRTCGPCIARMQGMHALPLVLGALSARAPFAPRLRQGGMAAPRQ